MSKAKKPYVKPEITIIPPDSPKYKEILRPLEHESRGQRSKITHPPPLPSSEKSQGVSIFQSAVCFDYFYGGKSEQFSYYRIPRLLVTGINDYLL